MEPLKANWKNTAYLWWAFIWRTGLLIIAIDIGVSFLAGLLVATAGVSPDVFRTPNATGTTIIILIRVVTLLLSLLVSLWMLKYTLRKRYKKFKVVLVPREDAQANSL